ncbi:protein LNK3 [Lotus japonicus]|uniref:protein LNK3 n=1 Tax=Lotus japonicus TaxID=34305 RepID=UPI00258C496A|nr:protein LNK3 [Lotus japonicus]
MDWYYGCGTDDFVVPNDQDLLDRPPSPENWSKWGISTPEDYYSSQKFFITDKNSTEVEFNFKNEVEFEPSQYDVDQSCDQLQELSSFEPMEDIYLNSELEDFPCVENLQNPFYFYPENQCSNTTGGSQKDISISDYVPCNLNSEDSLNTEAQIVKVLDPFGQSSGDEVMHEESSVEESALQDLESIISQFTEKTRIGFRDALYRLARSTKQQHVREDLDGDLNMQQAMARVVQNETRRFKDKKPMESETNSVDRAVANLMFRKMEINALETPDNQGKCSKALNDAPKSHYPQRFGQMDQQTTTESDFANADPIKKSFMLEFG